MLNLLKCLNTIDNFRRNYGRGDKETTVLSRFNDVAWYRTNVVVSWAMNKPKTMTNRRRIGEAVRMMLNYFLLMLQDTCTMIYVMLKWILFEVWLCVYALTAKRHVSLSLLHWYSTELHVALQKCVELNWIYKALTPNIKSFRLGIGVSTQSVRLVFHFTLYPTSIMKWIYI